MKTVVIEVLGGVVQEVYAEEDTRVIVVDWDEHEDDPSNSWVRKFNPQSLDLVPEEAEDLITSL